MAYPTIHFTSFQSSVRGWTFASAEGLARRIELGEVYIDLLNGLEKVKAIEVLNAMRQAVRDQQP